MKGGYDKPFIIRMPLPLFLKLGKMKEKAFVMAILSFSDNGKGTCWASLETIAKRAGMSVGLASILKRELTKKGILKVIKTRIVPGGNLLEVQVSPHLVKPRLQENANQASLPETIQLNETYKNKQYDDEILNTYNKKIDEIIEWAYTRSRTPPSCSEDAFRRAVVRGISRLGYKRVYSFYDGEFSAIAFLTNIKNTRN